MALYTIDPYTTIVQYNEALQALRNNLIPVKEFVSLRAPYHWYLDLPYAPLLVNYDAIEKGQLRYVVTKVKPIRAQDEYLLQRRESNANDLWKYVENQPLKEAREAKYALFFNAASFESLKNISKNIPGAKIYYFGKFRDNKFRIALCTHPLIKSFANANSFLIEKDNTSKGFRKLGGAEGTQGNQGNDYRKVGFFEADLNYRIFKQKDYLVKYSETPYFLDGEYYPVKFQKDQDQKGNRFAF